jgi:hypothetical protein
MIVWKDMSGFSAGGLLLLFLIVLSPLPFPVTGVFRRRCKKVFEVIPAGCGLRGAVSPQMQLISPCTRHCVGCLYSNYEFHLKIREYNLLI